MRQCSTVLFATYALRLPSGLLVPSAKSTRELPSFSCRYVEEKDEIIEEIVGLVKKESRRDKRDERNGRQDDKNVREKTSGNAYIKTHTHTLTLTHTHIYTHTHTCTYTHLHTHTHTHTHTYI